MGLVATWYLGFLAYEVVVLLLALLWVASFRRRRQTGSGHRVPVWDSVVEVARFALRSRRVWLVVCAFATAVAVAVLFVGPSHEARLRTQLADLQQHHAAIAAANRPHPDRWYHRAGGRPTTVLSAAQRPQLCFGVLAATERDTLRPLLASLQHNLQAADGSTSQGPSPAPSTTVTVFTAQLPAQTSMQLPSLVQLAVLPTNMTTTHANLHFFAFETFLAAGCDRIVLLEDDALPAAIPPGWFELQPSPAPRPCYRSRCSPDPIGPILIDVRAPSPSPHRPATPQRSCWHSYMAR